MARGIAADPRLPSIIAAVEGGRSMRATAKDFQVSEDSLNRYFARYGSRAPKVPGRPAVDTGTDGQSIWQRLQSQMTTLESMASAPGISSRAYLDTVGQMRLLAQEMSRHQPPVEQHIARLIVESEEWVRFRESMIDWLQGEDRTGGLEFRFRQLIARNFGPEDQAANQGRQ